MLLVLEIGLTIWAWRRGWKGWALLPPVICFGIGFVSGLFMDPFVAMTESENPAWILLDVACIGTLIFMVAKSRKKQEQFTASNFGIPVTPVIGQTPDLPRRIEPVTVIDPVTVLAPVNTSSLVLPDNSEISIAGEARSIGRSDLGRAVSPEAQKYISRQHLLVRSNNGRYFIEDSDSANGTKVNGVDITGRGRQELRDGDRIDVADAVSLTFKA
jgi:hypothetical protein